jgi:DNA polymerase-3 subunit beta
MKFSVTSGELQKSLASIGSVVPSKSALPILENFLFDLSNGELKITATDMEVSMIVAMPVKGAQKGKLAVPAKKLMDTMRALPLTQVEFQADTDNNKVEMKTDNGEYKLSGESSENYPSVPDLEKGKGITIQNEALRRLISKTSFAASTDELRPAMTGILFQINDKEIRAVATDGHRLVRVINSSFSTDSKPAEIIVPAKALNLFERVLESADSTMTFDETHAVFTTGSITLVSKIIQEKYPNYESVLPLDNTKKLRVSREQLLSSVKRTSLYASSTNHQVRFSLKKNSITISAEDIDFGSEAHETLTCDYSAEPMDIGFNSGYIVEVLSHLESAEVEFSLSTPARAVTIKPETQPQGEDILMLVMPVRLNA